MQRGIKVIWPSEDDADIPNEIEFFRGIDVERLDRIPPFTRVFSVWYGQEGGRPVQCIEYNVETRCEPKNPAEVHLVVRYDRATNEDLVREWGEINCWGTNRIILKRGEREGTCHWLHDDGGESYDVHWKAFDLGANREPARAFRIQPERYGGFRNDILGCDEYRCVLTGETTEQALDAAHLIPAAMAENDLPINGITLRTDLHRLFDACLFTFNADGEVILLDCDPGLSNAYVRLLREAHLPAATLRRVRETLASSEFRDRCNGAP